MLTGFNFPPPSQQLPLRNHTAGTAPAACAGVILHQRDLKTAAEMMSCAAIFRAMATLCFLFAELLENSRTRPDMIVGE